MRRSLLLSAALAGLTLAPAMLGAGAFAQGSTTSTREPASPNAASGMPQPTNSLPPGAGTATPNATPGSGLSTTEAAPKPQASRMIWLAQATAPAAPEAAPL